jgi:NAD(P)-dependent dehydrogenase (short-subunit alcohol dehydrogenase family)
MAGKRVLITGAARGMGRSHALRLAEEGADLILIDLCESLPELRYPLSSREDLEETARLVREQGRRAVTRVADVRDADAMLAAVAEGVAELGGLDASVANAGVSTAGTWDTTTAAQWRIPGLHPLLADERPDLAPIYANALPVRVVDARDVSNAVLFLVSDESRHVTGLQFMVDAGITIR